VNGLPPALDLYDDKTGKTRVDIDATRGVTLSDTNEEPRAILAVPGDGPTLALTGRHGHVTKIGSAHLMTALTGENHKASAASIVMWGKDGEVIWSAPPDN